MSDRNLEHAWRANRDVSCRLLPVLLVGFHLLVVAVQAKATTAADAENRVGLSLGYSFSQSSFNTIPTDATTALTNTAGNEPLITLSAEIQRKSQVSIDLKFGLANFGRLIAVGSPTDTASSSGNDTTSTTGDEAAMAADVRRSILADLSFRFRLWQAGREVNTSPLSVFLTLNTGFVFDAQDDKSGTTIEDASSYVFAGPSFRATFTDRSELMTDLLVGQSEVMTGHEIFSRSWKDSRTFRVRPRVRFVLDDADSTSSTSGTLPLTPLIIGFWGDLGFDNETGDTYAVFISKPIWSSPKR